MEPRKLYNRENYCGYEQLSPHYLETRCRKGTMLVIVNGVETTYCTFESYDQGEILFKWSITFNEAEGKVRAKVNQGRIAQNNFPQASVYLWPESEASEIFEFLSDAGYGNDSTIRSLFEHYAS